MGHLCETGGVAVRPWKAWTNIEKISTLVLIPVGSVLIGASLAVLAPDTHPHFDTNPWLISGAVLFAAGAFLGIVAISRGSEEFYQGPRGGRGGGDQGGEGGEGSPLGGGGGGGAEGGLIGGAGGHGGIGAGGGGGGYGTVRGGDGGHGGPGAVLIDFKDDQGSSRNHPGIAILRPDYTASHEYAEYLRRNPGPNGPREVIWTDEHGNLELRFEKHEPG